MEWVGELWHTGARPDVWHVNQRACVLDEGGVMHRHACTEALRVHWLAELSVCHRDGGLVFTYHTQQRNTHIPWVKNLVLRVFFINVSFRNQLNSISDFFFKYNAIAYDLHICKHIHTDLSVWFPPCPQWAVAHGGYLCGVGVPEVGLSQECQNFDCSYCSRYKTTTDRHTQR